jgi:hypothetical protein
MHKFMGICFWRDSDLEARKVMVPVAIFRDGRTFYNVICMFRH